MDLGPSQMIDITHSKNLFQTFQKTDFTHWIKQHISLIWYNWFESFQLKEIHVSIIWKANFTHLKIKIFLFQEAGICHKNKLKLFHKTNFTHLISLVTNNSFQVFQKTDFTQFKKIHKINSLAHKTGFARLKNYISLM